MKPTFIVLGTCMALLFFSCKPDFDLNAPYKDVTVVYGVLNHQDSIHFVKIYKGFQSHKKGGVFIDAQTPDSIYYYDKINVVLHEYKNDKPTSRKIPLQITHDFPRDSGFFYYDKEKIIYYTKESLSKDCAYKIVITHLQTKKETEGMAQILGNGIDFENFEIYSPSSQMNLLGKSKGSVNFFGAQYAEDYEFHVNFCYFEVDKNTKKATDYKIVKNICPKVGENWKPTQSGYYNKQFSKTFYDDIAAHVAPNPNVIRYGGSQKSPGLCIEIEGWAAGESMVKYLQSNQPFSSFVQVSTIYTNLTSSEDGAAFGFFSSKIKCPTKYFSATPESEDSLVKGPKTAHLGFKHYSEYKP
jgi:hypothetical protein